MRYRFLQGLAWAALASLSLQVACVDKKNGDTGSASLYVFDGNTNSVKAWDDVSALYDLGSGATAPAASRTITLSSLLGSGIELGWGGMALDSTNQRLYLVSSDGSRVMRVNSVGTQSGTPAYDAQNGYILFSLDNAGPGSLSKGVFGQASVNSNGDLYVTEYDSTGKSQIWLVPYASQVNGTTISTGVVTGVTGDTGCTGVAVNGTQAVYAYYDNGSDITLTDSTIYSGERLRSGTPSSGFSSASSNVILDLKTDATSVTELYKYGCLAFDSSSSGLLYVARQAASDPVLVFNPGDFGTSPQDIAPDTKLTGPTSGLLRIIAHAGQKDWMVGAESTDTSNTTGAGASKLWIWKAPSAGDTNLYVTLPGSLTVLGLALDGSQ